MTDENMAYITSLKVTDIPWHRITTTYGRGSDFPEHLRVLDQMSDLPSVKESFYKITANMEHQSTLWHVTPFGTVFLCRILKKAFANSYKSSAANFLCEVILYFFETILNCVNDVDEMEYANSLPLFSDLLKEEYLWSEGYDEEDDEMRYEDDEVFPDYLFLSFYHYSWLSVKAYESIFDNVPSEFADSAAKVLSLVHMRQV
ncbi:hypothetical protein [Anaerobiospirillum thomasii]|uniref:Uncharacterized protein n=1 Tax=Anaerobiospirillum thomasii TaxID=179995 RepID=A0A2X0WJB3_9GAMM|nr:hypothetical protein [Anaerobiospirillum thomasii]SPT70497.1 Uncharacterised protein [Anaerobiospirillum thomasii]